MNSITEAEKKWQEALSSGNTDRITRLYHKDAVLWGTLSPVIRNVPELIREYFKHFATLEGLKVTFHERRIRQYDDIAVNTGNYEFSWSENGRQVIVPARYSFVYKKEEDWLIIDHHSSVIPETPFDISKYINGI